MSRPFFRFFSFLRFDGKRFIFLYKLLFRRFGLFFLICIIYTLYIKNLILPTVQNTWKCLKYAVLMVLVWCFILYPDWFLWLIYPNISGLLCPDYMPYSTASESGYWHNQLIILCVHMTVRCIRMNCIFGILHMKFYAKLPHVQTDTNWQY